MSTAKTPAESKKRKRVLRVRFSLRSLLVLMLLCCAATAGWSVYINPFRAQLKAMDLAEQLGGQMIMQRAEGSSWHAWVVTKWLGENAFVEVHDLDLRDTQTADAHVSAIGTMRHLRSLNLDRCNITDKGMRPLNGLEQLQSLSLRYTQITSSALNSLSQMDHLQELHLTGTKVDDDGLSLISHLGSLREIYARWTYVTNAGAGEICESLPDCQVHVQTREDESTE